LADTPAQLDVAAGYLQNEVVGQFQSRGQPVSFRSCQAALLATAMTLGAASWGAAQSAHEQESAAKPSKAPRASQEVKLLDVTRVSTEEAAKRAAQEKARETARSGTKKQEDAEPVSASAVSEFKAVSKAEGNSCVGDGVLPKDSGKLPLKDIHGSIQGATGRGIREGGAEMGASSKSGKTHIYVKSERARTDPSTPQ
jgi:hypothetical protein